jgi:outer membrane lipoprotein-sorting protein
MKKWTIAIILLLLSVSIVPAQDLTGPEILDKMMGVMNPEFSHAKMKQTIITTTGQTRTLEYESFSGQGGKNVIMRYLEPARVRGNAMMMTDFSDNIWMYNKRTNRVRKLASHARKQKFEGSDFTYEDMGSGDKWEEDYETVLKGTEKVEGTDCYVLEMTAKSDDETYQKLLCFVGQEDFCPRRIDYYEDPDILLKSLILSDIQIIRDIPTPMKMTMKNHLESSETTMEYTNVTYDVEYPESFFSEQNLVK